MKVFSFCAGIHVCEQANITARGKISEVVSVWVWCICACMCVWMTNKKEGKQKIRYSNACTWRMLQVSQANADEVHVAHKSKEDKEENKINK